MAGELRSSQAFLWLEDGRRVLKLLCVIKQIGKFSVGCRVRNLLSHLERHKLGDVTAVAVMAWVVL